LTTTIEAEAGAEDGMEESTDPIMKTGLEDPTKSNDLTGMIEVEADMEESNVPIALEGLIGSNDLTVLEGLIGSNDLTVLEDLIELNVLIDLEEEDAVNLRKAPAYEPELFFFPEPFWRDRELLQQVPIYLTLIFVNPRRKL
jgi:hypothetical protein